jgi:WG containing repeat
MPHFRSEIKSKRVPIRTRMHVSLPFSFYILSLSILSGHCEEVGCSFAHKGPQGETEPEPRCFTRSQGIFTLDSAVTKRLAYDSLGLGWLATKNYGWVMVGKRRGVLQWGIAPYDNGPDAFRSGLIRIVHSGKWGYCDKAGKIVIPAIYDGAIPFEKGVGTVCTKCENACVDSDCEYHGFQGGIRIRLDTRGQPVKAAGK